MRKKRKLKMDTCPICKGYVANPFKQEVVQCPQCHCDFFSKIYTTEKAGKDE